MIAGILLAAGRGTRFGAHKLLHPLADGTPMVIAALRALQTGVDETFAVVRPNDRDLMDLLTPLDVQLVPCENADDGMGASLACGVRAAAHAQGWVIALGDMPFIAPATLRSIADGLRQGAALAAPSHQGRRGHPVGFASEFFEQLSALRGDQGAKSILDAHRAQLRLIECDDPGTVRDIDVASDLSA